MTAGCGLPHRKHIGGNVTISRAANWPGCNGTFTIPAAMYASKLILLNSGRPRPVGKMQ